MRTVLSMLTAIILLLLSRHSESVPAVGHPGTIFRATIFGRWDKTVYRSQSRK